MKNIKVLIFVLFISILNIFSQKVKNVKFDSILFPYKSLDKPGLAAGVLQNRKLLYLKGFGVEDIAGTSYIPMFMHGQYNFLTSNTTPFVSVLVGYEMALSNQEYNKGGFTTGAKVGINHYFSEHVGISTSFGYRYGYFKQENSFGWWSTPTTVIREINRFEFRFGLVFK